MILVFRTARHDGRLDGLGLKQKTPERLEAIVGSSQHRPVPVDQSRFGGGGALAYIALPYPSRKKGKENSDFSLSFSLPSPFKVGVRLFPRVPSFVNVVSGGSVGFGQTN